MKKVLSLVLAVILMFTICTPVFAARVGNTPVTVDGTIVGASFTVTIPATVTLPWETEEKNIKYTVACQLKTGDVVKVTVDDVSIAAARINETERFLFFILISIKSSFIVIEFILNIQYF